MSKDPRDILIRPVVSEKSFGMASEDNKYTFEVAGSANKVEIRQAIETQYQVRVVKVNTLWVKGKKRRLGRMPQGRTANWKKAVVTLVAGDSIAIFETG